VRWCSAITRIFPRAGVKTTGDSRSPVGPELLAGWWMRSARPSTARVAQRQADIAAGARRAGRDFPQSVSQPVQTGLKAIDSMVPIGRGQRDAHHRRPPDRQDRGGHRHIINQKSSGVSASMSPSAEAKAPSRTSAQAQEHGAMAHTIIVAARPRRRPPCNTSPPTAAGHGESSWQGGTRSSCTTIVQAGRRLSPDLAPAAPAAGRELPGDVFYLPRASSSAPHA